MTVHELLSRLVAFDTVSAKSNLQLIDFVTGYLRDFGVSCALDAAANGEKANLFATIGPDGNGGVVLSGHTDVVPVDGQVWRTNPFKLTQVEDRLHGRGAADMKGFIAVALALVPAMRARGLRRPIHLALSYDEEVGCTGVPSLLRRLGRDLPRLEVAIVGEPTQMQVVTRHKGIFAFETTITGVPAHSSAPQLGVNAIAYAAEVIGHLGRLSAELRAAAGDDAFDPPWTSVNIGMIEGGAAINIIAKDCRIAWEFRPLPGIDADAIERRVRDAIERQILPRMRAEHPAADIQTRRISMVPALVSESSASEFALQLAGHNHTEAVPFASEAGMFQQAGVPAVLCGPGSVAQAHQPDEYVTVAQLELCTRFLQRVVDWAAG